MNARRLLFLLAVISTVAGIADAEQKLPTGCIAKFADDRAAAISYTFDDGLRDQYMAAVPMLNEGWALKARSSLSQVKLQIRSLMPNEEKMISGHGEPSLGVSCKAWLRKAMKSPATLGRIPT
jgi:hypothetical protein